MIKEWRNNLFEPSNSKFSFYSMELPISIAEATRILGICYRTWKRWEELAMNVPEYKQQHMEMKQKALTVNALAPIVRYQVWVMGKIGEVYSELPHGITKKWIAQEYLYAKMENFTQYD